MSFRDAYVDDGCVSSDSDDRFDITFDDDNDEDDFDYSLACSKKMQQPQITVPTSGRMKTVHVGGTPATATATSTSVDKLNKLVEPRRETKVEKKVRLAMERKQTACCDNNNQSSDKIVSEIYIKPKKMSVEDEARQQFEMNVAERRSQDAKIIERFIIEEEGLSSLSRDYIWTRHAKERMHERKISLFEVLADECTVIKKENRILTVFR